MTKSILFNVPSTQLINILNGSQKMILTKKLPKDFMGWVYLACGKSRPYLNNTSGFNQLFDLPKKYNHHTDLNGKIVAKFRWDGNFENVLLTPPYIDSCGIHHLPKTRYFQGEQFAEYVCKKTCLTRVELDKYFEKTGGYIIPISTLEIFDTPKEVGEFIGATNWKNTQDGKEFTAYNLTTLPSTWRYVWGRE
jgi:hypothetical protein